MKVYLFFYFLKEGVGEEKKNAIFAKYFLLFYSAKLHIYNKMLV